MRPASVATARLVRRTSCTRSLKRTGSPTSDTRRSRPSPRMRRSRIQAPNVSICTSPAISTARSLATSGLAWSIAAARRAELSAVQSPDPEIWRRSALAAQTRRPSRSLLRNPRGLARRRQRARRRVIATRESSPLCALICTLCAAPRVATVTAAVKLCPLAVTSMRPLTPCQKFRPRHFARVRSNCPAPRPPCRRGRCEGRNDSCRWRNEASDRPSRRPRRRHSSRRI